MIPQYPYYGSETKCETEPVSFPPQHQDRQPAFEYAMVPPPISDNPQYRGSGKLQGKVAVITGGDSGIGRAVAIAYAKEGADVAIGYLDEHEDAAETVRRVSAYGRRCLPIPSDLRAEASAAETVRKTMDTFGRIDVLVMNQAVSYPKKSILNISEDQLDNTFRTNIYPLFFLTKAALPHLRRGSSIISTASATAYEGEPNQIDYAATKGAIVAFTRSLARQLIDSGIRVNAVAPGPVWTPLIVSAFPAEVVKKFGVQAPMKRAAQPFELAPTYVYLASDDSSYVTGHVLHVNGGMSTVS
ncbi:SDR family oxidoreductase [Cohnella sp. CFH 77786]|uniref:SDR family oxidoreductase n=1 Tax=Cohnella sp. CFH 77786 TaxID=2662265 RepID=UPI001C60F719|nr:SDR family oxidoreductase [Cohnella sp. CFH 77786]MBW5446853.1 SDR family oxidoreductase [Cohnella sp. CFH 77786]